ncbi:Fc.00g026300.m01.CDS01 [Cosmosporella sp. VM-42]
MASLTQTERDEIVAQILQDLSQTSFACTSLTPVSGGTVNFVFRGILTRHFPSRNETSMVKTIIIKHARNHLSGNKNYAIDASRCIYEESMLNALNSFRSASSIVRVPRLYLFNRETNTQVLEDFPDAVDMATIFVSRAANAILTQSVATSIGRELGSWLRNFHTWSSSPAQSALRREMEQNEPMRKLKRSVTYDSFINVLENFPGALEGVRTALEDVREMALKEFEKVATEEGEFGDLGLIHGDFWMGNVLATDILSLEAERPGKPEFSVIDWEFAQFGPRAYDLGQMIGDVYERKHFHNVDGALWTIRGFIKGYGGLSEEMAFRTAIHVGVHLLGWYTRRVPTSPLKGTPEQIADAVKLGRDFVLKGWEKDRTWFEGSVLASLFEGNKNPES